MKKISHIFDPLMSLFKIDYEKRLTAMLTMDFYEARKEYITTLQKKQNADLQLAYAENRVSTLTSLLAMQKEQENAKKSPNGTATSSTLTTTGSGP